VAAPRRPDPRRRADPARRPRPATRTRSTSGSGAPARPAAGGRGARLTTRAAVLGLVLCAVVVSAALPLREYLSQRGQISALEQQQRAQKERVAALQEQQRRLSDPARVAALARERLHFVLPGETAYVVVGPTAAPGAAAGADPAGAPAAGGPWYSQLWDSVRAADTAPR
jgi:cell division protein FtsL